MLRMGASILMERFAPTEDEENIPIECREVGNFRVNKKLCCCNSG